MRWVKALTLAIIPHWKIVYFVTVSLTKNGYSGYGIGFDKCGRFSFPGIGLGRNLITFGVDMSSSTKIDNRKKDILILGKGPTQ